MRGLLGDGHGHRRGDARRMEGLVAVCHAVTVVDEEDLLVRLVDVGGLDVGKGLAVVDDVGIDLAEVDEVRDLEQDLEFQEVVLVVLEYLGVVVRLGVCRK